MEELIELLEEIQPDADFENCDTLIDDGILDSFEYFGGGFGAQVADFLGDFLLCCCHLLLGCG